MSRHEITPAQTRTWVLAILLLTGLPIALTVVALSLTKGMQAMSPLTATAGIVGLLMLAALMLMALRRTSVAIEGDALIVHAGINSLNLPLAQLKPSGRVVDLSREPSLRPRWRSNGIGLPGFEAGHFRLRDGSKAFLMLTDTTRVVVLEELGGRKILLSVVRPEALLRELERRA